MDKKLDNLIDEIDRIRERMKKTVAESNPDQEICPGWTVKEIISHITAWEIVIHKAIRAFTAGDPPYFLREQDFDLFNQSAVEYRANWSLDQVLQEWKDIRKGLRDTLVGLDPILLEEELVLPWGSERTLAELIEILGEHEGEHQENILKVTG